MKFKVRESCCAGEYFISSKETPQYFLLKDGSLATSLVGHFSDPPYWNSRIEAERFLTNYKETGMDKAKLEQVKKDIELLKKEQAVIEQRIEDSKKYIFKAGDVIETMYGHKRLIVLVENQLRSIRLDGNEIGCTEYGQKHFVSYRYKKIGSIVEFIK